MNVQQMRYLLLALVAGGSLCAKKDKDSVLDSINQRVAYIAKTVTGLEEKQKCSTVIMQSDVGTSGYVINSPGDYCLGEDIVFAPANPATFTPITISDATGTGAEGLAAVSGGELRGIFVVNGGENYSDNPTVTIGGSGSGAAAIATVSGGVITNFTITSGGSGYQDTVQAAITISCSNVNLQLNNHRLSQVGVDAQGNVSPTQVPFVLGILIPDLLPADSNVNDVGLESIYISGDQAIVDGFSEWGLYISGHLSDIRLSNLTIKNCGKLASLASRTANPTLANYYFPTIADPGVSFAVGGLNIGETDIFGMGPQFFTQNSGVAQNRVSSVVISNITCLDNFFLGSNMSNTTDIALADSHIDNTFCDDPNLFVVGAAFAIAGVPYESPSILNMTIENTSFNNTTQPGDFMTELASGGGAVGMQIQQSQNIALRNCTIDGTTTTFAGDANVNTNTTGCLCLNVTSATFENCSFSGVRALFGAGAFTFSNGSDLRVIGCVAQDNQQIANQQLPAPVLVGEGTAAWGFIVSAATNVYFEDSVVSDTICYGPLPPSGYVAGFELEFGSVNVVYRNCITQRSITYQGGVAHGFKIDDFSDNIIAIAQAIAMENCIVEGCMALVPTLPDTVQGAAVGFEFQASGSQNNVQNLPFSCVGCKALHNKGALFLDRGNRANGRPLGRIYSAGFFDGSANDGFPTEKHYYGNCEAIDNIYGFFLSNDQKIIVSRCRADLNVADDGVTGEGFTDLGLSTTSTPSGVTQSFSLFENNKAFENGAGSTHFGLNGNYNVVYGAAATDYVPTLTGNLTIPNAIGGSYFPEANYIAHNLSITQS